NSKRSLAVSQDESALKARKSKLNPAGATPDGVLLRLKKEHDMNLRIRDADLAVLQKAICPLDTNERRARYQSGKFPYAEGCRDINMRYRWDLVYASGMRFGDGRGMQGSLNLYSYLNDKHIDAALRSFIPPLNS
ncbi:hypothetical protein, partial [Diaphorobacter sp. J5-51]|uniref:hypothetical protein n=1 Tax=Diaphorobacter sp. J5-51 TaxID=680496 RepID=UPI001F410420